MQIEISHVMQRFELHHINHSYIFCSAYRPSFTKVHTNEDFLLFQLECCWKKIACQKALYCLPTAAFISGNRWIIASRPQYSPLSHITRTNVRLESPQLRGSLWCFLQRMKSSHSWIFYSLHPVLLVCCREIRCKSMANETLQGRLGLRNGWN